MVGKSLTSKSYSSKLSDCVAQLVRVVSKALSDSSLAEVLLEILASAVIVGTLLMLRGEME